MNWELSERYDLYHVTAAPRAEPQKNLEHAEHFKETDITALKKKKIAAYIDTIIKNIM